MLVALRGSTRIHEIVPLCRVDSSKIRVIEAVAQNAEIHNEAPGYNCQDFVLQLLGLLEDEGVIDGSDGRYQRNKTAVESKVEGLA